MKFLYRHTPGTQPPSLSFIETVTGKLTSGVVSWLITLGPLAWWLDVHILPSEALGITGVYFIASVAVTYVVRRIFAHFPRGD